MDYLTPEEMREAEERAARRGLDTGTLMENAGKAVASIIEDRYPATRSWGRILVVCGTGNNGGDGLVAARYLKRRRSVLVLLLGTPFGIKTAEARTNWGRVEGSVVTVDSVAALRKHQKYFDRADIIIDAILGTGGHGQLREPVATAVEMVNNSRAVKVAVDVPSGLDPLTGERSGSSVRADLTIALHMPKLGLRGRDEYTGEVTVAPIGMDE
jgi:ADP-dependent NAD(P)H-hydrate dehydratase / NAD(P)H-hydrate epimerase